MASLNGTAPTASEGRREAHRSRKPQALSRTDKHESDGSRAQPPTWYQKVPFSVTKRDQVGHCRPGEPAVAHAPMTAVRERRWEHRRALATRDNAPHHPAVHVIRVCHEAASGVAPLPMSTLALNLPSLFDVASRSFFLFLC